MSHDMDSVDYGILYLLQKNARRHTNEDIGESVDVSASTAGKRIQELEDKGVIQGYVPQIDYHKAGVPYHVYLVATVPFDEMDELVELALETVDGVVSVGELVTSHLNCWIELVGKSQMEIETSIRDLQQLGFMIRRLELVRNETSQPVDHFGKQFTDDGE